MYHVVHQKILKPISISCYFRQDYCSWRCMLHTILTIMKIAEFLKIYSDSLGILLHKGLQIPSTAWEAGALTCVQNLFNIYKSDQFSIQAKLSCSCFKNRQSSLYLSPKKPTQSTVTKLAPRSQMHPAIGDSPQH